MLLTHLMSAFSPEERLQLADLLERFVASVDDFVEGLTADDASADDPAPRPVLS